MTKSEYASIVMRITVMPSPVTNMVIGRVINGDFRREDRPPEGLSPTPPSAIVSSVLAEVTALLRFLK
jgi:hypothetical protein